MGADLVPNRGHGTSSAAWMWVASHPQTLHKPMNNDKTPLIFHWSELLWEIWDGGV